MSKSNDFIKMYKDVEREGVNAIGLPVYNLLFANGNNVHHGRTSSGRNVHSFTEIVDKFVVEVVFTFKQDKLDNVYVSKKLNVYTDDGGFVRLDVDKVDRDWLSKLANYDEIVTYEKLIDSIGDKLHGLYYSDVTGNNRLTGLNVVSISKRGVTLCTEIKEYSRTLDRFPITRALVVVDDNSSKVSAVDALLAAREAREELCPRLARINTFDDVLLELNSYDINYKVGHVDDDYLVVLNTVGGVARHRCVFTKDESGRPLLLSNHSYRNIECSRRLNEKLNKFFNVNAEPGLRRMKIINALSNEA